MKAIVEVAPAGSIFRTVQMQLDQSASGEVPDFRLSFESAATLFATLTPRRLELLTILRSIGPCAVAALTQAMACDFSDIQTEVARLELLGLIERDNARGVTVPFESVEFALPLPQQV